MVKRILALLLAAVLLLSAVGCGEKSAKEASAKGSQVSRVIMDKENGTPYIEYQGKPYLFYGTQVRLDNIRERWNSDAMVVDEVLRKAAEDGFKTVGIPVKWYQLEVAKDQWDFSLMDVYYTALEKYDLTIQWLWFGTNVCADGACAAKYVFKDTETYKRQYREDGSMSNCFDFSCEATKEREKNAVKKFMEYIAKRDKDKRCVMIQMDNEVSHGGPNFDLGKDVWYKTEEDYFKYGWVGGQQYEFAEHVNDLGDIVHASDYNCVVRVNLMQDAWQVGRDIVDVLLAGSGVDIVGIDAYEENWIDIEKYMHISSDNMFHFAEASSNYDHSWTVTKFMADGIGYFSYPYADFNPHHPGHYYEDFSGVKVKWVEKVQGNGKAGIVGVRAFNKMIAKCGDHLAQAIADDCVAAFNYEHLESEILEKRIFGEREVQFSCPTDGYGMAFWLTEKEFIVMASNDRSSFRFDGTRIKEATSGQFDGNKWVKDKDQDLTIKGNRVTLDAYQVVKVVIE